MRWFRDLSISRKLAIVFVIMLCMMGIGGMVGIYNAEQISSVTKRLYLDSFKKVELLSGVNGELLAARQEIFLYAIVKDPASKDFLGNRVLEREKAIKSTLSTYNAMALKPGDRLIYDNLQKALDQFWRVHKRILSISLAKDRDRAISIAQIEGHKTFTSAMNALNALEAKSRSEAMAAYDKSGFFSRIIIAVTLAFTLSAIALAIGLWLALRRSIVAPILAIESSARSIASGDLSGRVPVMSDDEIGSLAVEFNLMSKSLREYYDNLESRVRERTDELRNANEDLHGKQRELELANMGLSEANKMKTQFLANVSHELRTPLNSILGFSELLSEKAFGNLNDKQNQYVEYIHSSGEHLLRLINNIIDLSKIDVEKMEMLKELFPITEALGEVLSIIRPLAHEKNISIETMAVAASPMIRADKSKFKKIMLNIISNAVKFNKAGGSVSITWEISEEAEGRDFKRFILFSVRDTGIGIKETDQARLFKTFEQVDSSFNREYDGSGLGLVLTRRLTELHGGRIWIESEEGHGTTVYIKFPQGTADVEMPDFSDFLNADYSSGGKPLVLIASESVDINHLMEIYLAESRYDTHLLSDGMELLNMAIDKLPFAIIIGINLPGKDGWEVLRELKACEQTANIPVIVVSSAEDSELSLSLGAVAHIGRSIDSATLLGALDAIGSVRTQSRSLKKILLIDNFPSDTKDAVESLEGAGYEIITAKADASVVELVPEAKPDCLLVRINADDELGPIIELVTRLRVLDGLKGAPFVVLTPRELSKKFKHRLMASGARIVISEGETLCKTIFTEIKNLQYI